MLQHIHLDSERKKVTVSYLCCYGISFCVTVLQQVHTYKQVVHSTTQTETGNSPPVTQDSSTTPALALFENYNVPLHQSQREVTSY